MFVSINIDIAVNVCFFLTLLIDLARVILRKVRREAFTLSDHLTFAGLVCVVVSVVCENYIMIYGDNNVSMAELTSFTQEQIHEHQNGARLTLALRFFYDTYLWLLKFVVLDLYACMIRRTVHFRFQIIVLALYLILSITAVHTIEFTECSALIMFWFLDPGGWPCSTAQKWFLTYGILNLFTDLALFGCLLCQVFVMRLQHRQKLHLYCLFSLAIFPMAATIVRLSVNAKNPDVQTTRSLWGALECVVATFVAHAPALYGMLGFRERAERASDERALARAERARAEQAGKDLGRMARTAPLVEKLEMDDLEEKIAESLQRLRRPE